MAKNVGRPYASTRLVPYLQKRILELRPKKTQITIASEAGFEAVNTLSMIKTGRCKLPLDRVPSLARALEDDPARLFQMALEQLGIDSSERAIDSIFGAVVSRNERAWLDCLRDASNQSDPALTSKAERALRALFGR